MPPGLILFSIFIYLFQNKPKESTNYYRHYEATETLNDVLEKQMFTVDPFQQTFLSTILSALDNHTGSNHCMLTFLIPTFCYVLYIKFYNNMQHIFLYNDRCYQFLVGYVVRFYWILAYRLSATRGNIIFK